ncbi:MAG: SctK family type III secretion system sorting platform protein [Nitrospirae bacterium]|nr:SctK family type III secretion system sorting platform protein [Nitrospirota bacterium]
MTEGKDRLKELFNKRDTLLGRMYEFNELPVRYMHTDWYGAIGLDEPLSLLIDKSARGQRRLSDYILSKCAIDAREFYSFGRGLDIIALLDAEPLKTLVLLCGVVNYSRYIRGIIDRQTVNKTIGALGAKVYDFAVKRATLLFPDIGGKTIGEGAVEDLAIGDGMDCLRRALNGADKAVIKRMHLKLPKRFVEHWHDGAAIEPVDEGTAAEAAFIAKRILLKEIKPEWAGLLS